MTHFAQGWNPSCADLALSYSVNNVRDELYWSEVEQIPGAYTFPSIFESYMGKLKQDHIAPLVILDFENPLYDGGNTPYTPDAISAYGKYAEAVLKHYGSQIKAVEVWNEFNGSFCIGPATESRAATYTAILKQAYAGVKAIRPDVTVVGGSTSTVALPYWKELMADGALAYMDALSIHPYRYDSPPEGIEHDIVELQALIKQYNGGNSMPIWVTEIGWEEQNSPFPVDDATLAKYVIRANALLVSLGINHVYWYLLHDDPNEDMGLFYSNMNPKPAALAMQELIKELSGAPFLRKEATPDNVYSMLFQRTNGTMVRIMWSPTFNLSLSLHGVTKAVDMFGNSLGTSGEYTLSDAPIFVEGNISGVPAPSPSLESIVTDSAADFAGVQGSKGWTYGYVLGSGAFVPMPTYTSDEWNYFWTANFPYLSVTETDMHPSLSGTTNVSAVRRWTSDRTGLVHIVGDFQGTTEGDGVGVSILMDGRPALSRQIIGASNSATKTFDLYENVNVGSTIDFIVDVGPASNMNFDATNFSVQILATGSGD
jgi:hypothetical protein